MKTLVTAIALSLGLATSLHAQDADRPTREDLNSDRLITELGLSGNQAEQVRAVNDRYAQELAGMKQGDHADVAAFKAERKALFERRDADLKKALTAEQWEKLKELRAQWRAQRKEAKAVPAHQE